MYFYDTIAIYNLLKQEVFMTKKSDLRTEIIHKMLLYGSITRPELVRLTATRAATVFEVVDELKKEGILSEPERRGKKTGRRAPALSFHPDCFWCAGIDFQVRKTLGAVTDMAGNIHAEAELPALERTSLHACRNEIREVLRRLREQLGEKWSLVRGIGFADPGLVDTEKGVSIRAVNVPGWENAQTGKWLESENTVRAKLWPECMVKTYMEYLSRIHTEKPPKSLFHLGMDDGIGGGFVKDGVCFIGDSNQGMEIGHIVVAPNGPLCQCGNRGCLEAVAGETGIRRRIREALNSGVDTELTLEDFSLAKFVEYAKYDKAAKIIANEVCDSIGSALAVAVALLNPSMIVLSGELTKLGPVLTNAIGRSLSMNCFAGAIRALKIELSTLGAFDTARGAALLMRDALLKED